MKYHYKKPDLYLSQYGRRYECDHVAYNRCTLFEINGKGIAVIQQRFNQRQKITWWSEIDPWLTDAIYLHPNFINIFEERARSDKNGVFPTMTVRQIMWALRMKPLKKHEWETVFDRKDI